MEHIESKYVVHMKKVRTIRGRMENTMYMDDQRMCKLTRGGQSLEGITKVVSALL